MKKSLPIIVFILALSSLSIKSFGQQTDCQKFKDGTFEFIGKDSTVEYIIIRKGDLQKEQAVGEKSYSTFHVTWINECTYVLKMTKKTIKKNPDIPSDMLVTVAITSTTANSYTQSTTSNKFSFVLTGTMRKIK